MKESERIVAMKLARSAQAGVPVVAPEVAGKIVGSVEVGGGGRVLKAEQQKALEMLLEGRSIVETAREAGVSRKTVYKWLKSDPVFMASYNEWHEEMKDSARSRMLMLMDKAADAVEKSLVAGDGKLGMRVLEKMGMARERAAGPTDAERLKKEKDVAKRREAIELQKAMEEIEMAEMWPGGLAGDDSWIGVVGRADHARPWGVRCETVVGHHLSFAIAEDVILSISDNRRCFLIRYFLIRSCWISLKVWRMWGRIRIISAGVEPFGKNDLGAGLHLCGKERIQCN